MSPTVPVQHDPTGTFPPLDPVVAGGARGWPDVHIEHVAVEPAGADQPAGWYRISAVIRLGNLTPADVVVCLMPVSGDPDDAMRMEGVDRLWSVFPYNNGAYRFEAEVPAERLRSRERLKIHVGPQRDQLTSYTRGSPSGCWHLLPAEILDPEA